jgi:hypothetical protein
MTDKEAMKLALFALDIVKIHYTQNRHVNEAITALKERLAQPEQEPVAWLSIDSIGKRYLCFDKPLDNDPVQPLYIAPQPQEFVCSTGLCHFTLTQTNVGIAERGMQAYEEAKKRGWVGLSDERLMEMPKQEPVKWADYEPDGMHHNKSPQRTEPICPECKAEVLYECVACGSNNYPPKETT